MRLLAIFAHPDDEVFSCGGTLARAAAEGHDAHLICATRGEEGEINHPDIDTSITKGPPRGRLREAELEEACYKLGIHPPVFLDYHDSGFPVEVGFDNPHAFMNQDLFEVEQQLLPYFAEIEPQVIITFDPHGGYGHIDHLMIHRAVSATFWSSGAVMQPAPRRLFYPAHTIAEMEARNANTEHPRDPRVYGFSPDSFAAVLDNSPYRDQKLAGIAAHRSQVGPRERWAPMVERWGERFTKEMFTLGGLRGGFPAEPVLDLFEGLD